MKEAIKQEKKRILLKEELITDNDLLLYIHVPEEDKVYVKIRFITENNIVEHYVARLSMDEYLEGNRIRFNEDKTALAVFKKNDANEEVLENFYSLEEHSCECSDFLDCAYNLHFKDEVNDYLVLIKK